MMSNYTLLRTVWTGHRHTMQIAPYCDTGFSTRHQARHYRDKVGESDWHVVRDDRVYSVIDRYERANN